MKKINGAKAGLRLLLYVLPLLTGCVTRPVGEPSYEKVVKNYVRRTDISKVEEVTAQVKGTRDTISVDIRADTVGALLNVETRAVKQIQREITVGLFPGLPAQWEKRDDPWYGGHATCMLGFMPFGYAYNIVLYPTIQSLFIEPFRGESAYTEYNPGTQWFVYAGLLGCIKNKSALFYEETVTNVVQSAIASTEPVKRVLVKLDCAELNYHDSQETDEKGMAVFTILPQNSRQAEVTITLQNVSKSGLADHLAPFLNKSWSFTVPFDDGRPPPSDPKKRDLVAIADITVTGIPAGEVKTLSEWLHNSIEETKKFQLVTRNDMNSILKEQQFQRVEACDDSQCLVEMGKILAVHKIIGGTLGPVGEKMALIIRLVDVETGEIICSAKGYSSKDSEAVLKMIGDVSVSLCDEYAKVRSKNQ